MPPKRRGTKRLALGALALFFGAFIALAEYSELHSGAWFTGLLETEIWSAAVIFGVLGLIGIGSGLLARKQKSESD